MGVPKFFRYISERYPLILETVNETEIPMFDNVYLDMNGIIHSYTHPNDSDPTFHVTEEKMFKDIFHYIEVLFRIMKPQKLFFMAVDGVAPRAKMNQQRARRFKSAKENQLKEKEYIRKGGVLTDVDKFDSNCITPGTEFMTALQEQLKYFLSYKVTTESAWQKPKIILSGHQVPGEGEHKIMDYIRYLRSQDDYDCNTRHCIYGLDADLITLGLSIHEPHFALFREEVTFGRQGKNKKMISPDDTKFSLLHLSLFREYLDMEFEELKHTLPFEYNLENIIDDWVMMVFLVGNDFIPHLPNVHIAYGALPVLYSAYIKILPQMDGYINEGGSVNLARFRKLMRVLASYELRNFEHEYRHTKYSAEKSPKVLEKFENHDDLAIDELDNQDVINDLLELYKEGSFFDDWMKNNIYRDEQSCNTNATKISDVDNVDTQLTEEEKADSVPELVKEFVRFKAEYYREKMCFYDFNRSVLKTQAEGYVRAIQWNLHYYYDGVCSWSWYYPFHYAPYAYDIQTVSDEVSVQFDYGNPFLPFEQLLAVLPSLSKSLVPVAFQKLMIDNNSDIIDFFPNDFKTDLNGKQQDWEAVVLIPFIDETRLLKAMKHDYHRLTQEEQTRNKHGPMHVFTYTEEKLGERASNYLPALKETYAMISTLTREDVHLESSQIKKGLLPQLDLNLHVPGFPTFRYLQYTANLERRRLTIFQFPSRYENMIIKVRSTSSEICNSLMDVVSELSLVRVYINWPYLVEAQVVGALNKDEKYMTCSSLLKNIYEDEFNESVRIDNRRYLQKGVEIGSTEVLVLVKKMVGKRTVYSDEGIEYQKIWSNEITPFPLHMLIRDTGRVIAEMNEDRLMSLDEFFPVDSLFFCTSHLLPQYYGCQCYVCSVVVGENSIKVRLKYEQEPDVESWKLKLCGLKYRFGHYYAKQLGMTTYAFSRITGSVLVSRNDSKHEKAQANIGLNLKFSLNNREIPGYTKRDECKQWRYSANVCALVSDYAENFPDVFYALQQSGGNEVDLLKIKPDFNLDRLLDWLTKLPTSNMEARKCSDNMLDPEVIKLLELRIDEFLNVDFESTDICLIMKPEHLYKPIDRPETINPDIVGEFNLLDRVVNIRADHSVPIGLRGTIIASIENDDGNSGGTLYEVLFDRSFPTGVKSYCRKNCVYTLRSECLLNISNHRRPELLKLHAETRLKSMTANKCEIESLNKIPETLQKPPCENVDADYEATTEYFKRGLRISDDQPSTKNLDNAGHVNPVALSGDYCPSQNWDATNFRGNDRNRRGRAKTHFPSAGLVSGDSRNTNEMMNARKNRTDQCSHNQRHFQNQSYQHYPDERFVTTDAVGYGNFDSGPSYLNRPFSSNYPDQQRNANNDYYYTGYRSDRWNDTFNAGTTGYWGDRRNDTFNAGTTFYRSDRRNDTFNAGTTGYRSDRWNDTFNAGTRNRHYNYEYVTGQYEQSDPYDMPSIYSGRSSGLMHSVPTGRNDNVTDSTTNYRQRGFWNNSKTRPGRKMSNSDVEKFNKQGGDASSSFSQTKTMAQNDILTKSYKITVDDSNRNCGLFLNITLSRSLHQTKRKSPLNQRKHLTLPSVTDNRRSVRIIKHRSLEDLPHARDEFKLLPQFSYEKPKKLDIWRNTVRSFTACIGTTPDEERVKYFMSPELRFNKTNYDFLGGISLGQNQAIASIISGRFQAQYDRYRYTKNGIEIYHSVLQSIISSNDLKISLVDDPKEYLKEIEQANKRIIRNKKRDKRASRSHLGCRHTDEETAKQIPDDEKSLSAFSSPTSYKELWKKRTLKFPKRLFSRQGNRLVDSSISENPIFVTTRDEIIDEFEPDPMVAFTGAGSTSNASAIITTTGVNIPTTATTTSGAVATPDSDSTIMTITASSVTTNGSTSSVSTTVDDAKTDNLLRIDLYAENNYLINDVIPKILIVILKANTTTSTTGNGSDVVGVAGPSSGVSNEPLIVVAHNVRYDERVKDKDNILCVMIEVEEEIAVVATSKLIFDKLSLLTAPIRETIKDAGHKIGDILAADETVKKTAARSSTACNKNIRIVVENDPETAGTMFLPVSSAPSALSSALLLPGSRKERNALKNRHMNDLKSESSGKISLFCNLNTTSSLFRKSSTELSVPSVKYEENPLSTLFRKSSPDVVGPSPPKSGKSVENPLITLFRKSSPDIAGGLSPPKSGKWIVNPLSTLFRKSSPDIAGGPSAPKSGKSVENPLSSLFRKSSPDVAGPSPPKSGKWIENPLSSLFCKSSPDVAGPSPKSCKSSPMLSTKKKDKKPKVQTSLITSRNRPKHRRNDPLTMPDYYRHNYYYRERFHSAER